MYEDREIAVTTPFSPEDLRFAFLEGEDEVSAPFLFHLGLLSENYEIAAEDILGKAFCVRVGMRDDMRYFHGLAAEFRLERFESGFAVYVVVLRPWLWFLTNSTDNRIFQNLSTIEIIEEVFSAYPAAKLEKRLQGNYDPREYCAQYGETDLAFVHRLIEDEGIFYYFEHADGEHTLVIADSNGQFAPVPGLESVPYQSDAFVTFRDGDYITNWQPCTTVATGAYVQTDYDFEKPSADLATKADNPLGHPQDDDERYHYPGKYTEMGPGDGLTQIRLQEVQAPSRRAEGLTTAPAFWSGTRLELTGFPREAENETYIVLRAAYRAWNDQYRSGAREERPPEAYEATLTLAPMSLPFRPERRTPWPVMKGPQTATVVGPAGAEIFTDEFSRVKVQFHWDRGGVSDENSSCYVRVSSVWAGSGWGFVQIPRIGQEVIVDFLEGDPDRPLITGRVYNASQMPPYGLPGSATQSGWKSNSSPGGGGWNELRFEDKKGAEEVYFQAEKDHNELVKNNESRAIGNDFSEDVGHDATQHIGNNRSESVDNDKDTTVGNNRVVKIGSNDTESVGVDRSLTVGANETIAIGSNSTETIGMNHTQTVAIAQTITVGAARADTVGAAEVRTVGGAQTQTVGAVRAVTVGASQNHQVGASDSWSIASDRSASVGGNDSASVGGDQSIDVKGGRQTGIGKSDLTKTGEDFGVAAGKNIVLEAADQITLKCGSASVILKKDGTIEFEGKDVATKASGKVNITASGEVTIKGSKINQN